MESVWSPWQKFSLGSTLHWDPQHQALKVYILTLAKQKSVHSIKIHTLVFKSLSLVWSQPEILGKPWCLYSNIQLEPSTPSFKVLTLFTFGLEEPTIFGKVVLNMHGIYV